MSLLLVVVCILVLMNIVLLFGLYQKLTNSVCVSGGVLCGRTAVVTGGTAGMGLQIARDLAQRGARLIVACPEPQEGARALTLLHAAAPTNHDIRYHPLNLACFASTRNFATHILATEDRLDILVNNAGVCGPNSVVTSDGLNYVVQVNYYGTFLLTLLLLPLLKKTGRPGEPSRIVNVSSSFYIFGSELIDKSFLCNVPPFRYCLSKLYIVVFTRELAKRLKGSNVVVNSADPGAVGTDIFRTVLTPVSSAFYTYIFWTLFKNVWEGAQTALHVAFDQEAGEVSGECFRNCKRVRTASRACDDKLATRVWNKSVKAVGMTDKELDSVFNNPLSL